MSKLNSIGSRSMGGLVNDVQMIAKALMRDIVASAAGISTALITFVADAGTAAAMAQAAAWECWIEVTLKDAAGNVHTWMDQEVAAILSIADTQVGVAATFLCPGASLAGNLLFKNGKAMVKISGPSAVWSASSVTLTIADMAINGATVTCVDPVITFAS